METETGKQAGGGGGGQKTELRYPKHFLFNRHLTNLI